MNILKWLKSWGSEKIDNLLGSRSNYPIRIPEKAEEWFTTRCMFPQLTPEQKRAILAIVFEELRKSEKEFGLVVRDEDVYTQEWVFLHVCDNGGGIEAMRVAGFNETAKKMGQYSQLYFSEAKDHYFEKDDGKNGSRLKYNCHLEAIRSRLMIDIFNNKI